MSATADTADRHPAAPSWGFATRAIHAGQAPDPHSGAVVTPIVLSSTFAQPHVGAEVPYEYSRSGNPTRHALETCLASLEDATHGIAFSSGLAAADAVLRLVADGAGVVIGADAYGGTYRLLSQVHRHRFEVADLTDPDVLAAGLPQGTAMVWLESPTNPKLGCTDLAAVADAAHRAGALLVVDNTFASPYLQQPLRHGADVVLHSSTKYLGGHSDVIGGAVLTSNDEAASRLRFLQNAAGAVPSPFDCYLVLRGLKTLALRMEAHCNNAEAVVGLLAAHPAVAEVFYPGRDGTAGASAARRQMRRGGGMVSFTLRGGEDAALALVSSTRLFTLAESLGAVESLIEHPARMTHASVAGSPLEVPASLVRLSVGVEDAADLLADLRQALDLLTAGPAR